MEWDVHLDSQHSAPLVKWHKIVLADPLSFDVCGMPFQSLRTVLYGGKFQDDLRNVLSSKSTSTLHGRVGPMRRSLRFCADKQLKVFPITEEVVYAFMQHVEQSAAPTFLRSFLSSLGFALHVVGLVGTKRVLDSRRIKGLADECHLQKKKTRSRLPQTVQELTLLEETVLGYRGRGLPDGHAADCLLFMVYRRTRFSNMRNVERLDFELIYGKDNTSAGLREIDVNFEAIRQGDFLPDAKRSEMFHHAEDAAKLLENQDQSGFEDTVLEVHRRAQQTRTNLITWSMKNRECSPRQVGCRCGRRQAARSGGLLQAPFVEDDPRPRGRIRHQVYLRQRYLKELHIT